MRNVTVTVGAVPVINVSCSAEHDDFLVYEVSVGSPYDYQVYVEDGKPTLWLFQEGVVPSQPSRVAFDVPPDYFYVERAGKNHVSLAFYRKPTLENTRLMWVRSSS